MLSLLIKALLWWKGKYIDKQFSKTHQLRGYYIIVWKKAQFEIFVKNITPIFILAIQINKWRFSQLTLLITLKIIKINGWDGCGGGNCVLSVGW